MTAGPPHVTFYFHDILAFYCEMNQQESVFYSLILLNIILVLLTKAIEPKFNKQKQTKKILFQNCCVNINSVYRYFNAVKITPGASIYL